MVFLLFLVSLIVPKGFANAVEAETSSDGEQIKSLIAKVINAYGGKRNIENVKTVYARGNINAFAFDDKGVYVYYFERPGRLRVEIKYSRSSELRILDDGEGYESVDSAPITKVKGVRYLAMLFQYKQLDLPYGLSVDAYQMHYEGKANLNGVKVDVISLNDKEGPPMKVYIDTEKFFIRKSSGYFSITKNSVTTLSSEFADFKRIDGIVLPFKITNFADGQKIAETIIREYKLDTHMENSIFLPQIIKD
jgi:hypothetical protein